jgi:hypothetical protein
MKNFKNSLHILLTFVSLLGFLGGWATLAHSRKPVQTVSDQPQALAPLAPLPALDSNNSNAPSSSPLNIITQPTRRSRSRSMFSTGGS